MGSSQARYGLWAPDRQLLTAAPRIPGGWTGQESLHSGLYRPHHCPRVVERGAGSGCGGSGTRLCRLASPRQVNAMFAQEGEQAPHPQRPPGAWTPTSTAAPSMSWSSAAAARPNRSYVKPNILEAIPTMGHGPETRGAHRHGGWLKAERIRDPGAQCGQPGAERRLQPFRYLRDEKDALKLVNNLIQATTRGAGSPLYFGTSSSFGKKKREQQPKI